MCLQVLIEALGKAQRHLSLQVAAHEQELDACQKRLAAREGEVREVKELLQASLQPRMAAEPVPKLISLESAAAELDPVADAQALRKQAPFQISKQALGGHGASIARDPTLSAWQAEQARAAVGAEQAQQYAAADSQQQGSTDLFKEAAATPAAETRSMSPRKKSAARRSASSTAGFSALQRHRPPSLSIHADRENMGSPNEGVTPRSQRQDKPGLHLDGRRWSLHSAPSTPLSPTNASMAPTRRLPQRPESGTLAQVGFVSLPVC